MRFTYVVLFLLGFFLSGCATTTSCVNPETGVNECLERRLEMMGDRGGRF